jgi:hypothetical protein
MEKKVAVLKQEMDQGFTKLTMTYPSGKTFTRWTENDPVNLRREMERWAEERGFIVKFDFTGVVFGK